MARLGMKHWLWGVAGTPMILAGALGGLPAATGAQGGPPPVGGPIAGLSPTEIQRFDAGRQEFLQNEAPPTGLGPVFNGVSCAECHQAGAPGGASANLGVSVVTRIGAIVNGQYSDLENVGGPLIQARSLREILGPQYPVGREVIPSQAQFVSRRITTPVFGMGLIEAIPQETILARAGMPQGGGIMGEANMIFNPETGQTEVGRFGWKSQVPTIHLFAGDAYRNEMGITNPTFNSEVLPQGQPIPPGADQTPDPEDPGPSVNRLSDFMRFSAPPTQLAQTPTSLRGQATFQRIQCGSCHVPSMTTGNALSPALRFKQVNLYSDLLLHRIGARLADGIRQGDAEGDQFRTAPLWGLRFRRFFLHDGRATTVDEAIRMHGGEATKVIDLYTRLNRGERSELLDFLNRI